MRNVSIVLMMLTATQAFANGPDREAIRQTVKEHLKDVRACYEKDSKSGTTNEGKLLVDWTVDDKGAVTKADKNEAKTSLASENIANCVIGKLKTWKFSPAPSGQTVSVSYPFYFSK